MKIFLFALVFLCATNAFTQKTELTTTSLKGKTSLAASDLSIWDISLGMTQAEFMAIIETHSNLETMAFGLDDGTIVINVLEKELMTDYDLFSVLIGDDKILEITLFTGLSRFIPEFNDMLVTDAITDPASAVYTGFLGAAGPVTTENFDKNSGKDERAFPERGFLLIVRRDMRYSDGALRPYREIAFVLKGE